MSRHEILTGVVLEEVALSTDELACACAVETVWVIEHVHAGLLEAMQDEAPQHWRFASAQLRRARRLIEIESSFDANPEVAALVVDLMDELQQLRQRLAAAGLK